MTLVEGQRVVRGQVMATGVATLSRVLLKATANGRSPATDQELLRRFADSGDQSAFETLVRRHSALVLSVCRRSLANIQDAEDACQATFLILARKARGNRWQPSIVNWLFATARRVSRDLRRSAQRRSKREGKAAVPESVLPVDRMTGREMLAVIDEELDRLPSIYREALLLYYHAELAREEIASRLHISPATVKTRLERGRKKLGTALTRRGIVMSAGLLALVATSRAGASPPRLCEMILSAAAGHPSPAVAALVEGVAMNGIIKKSVFLALAVATLVALGMGMGSATHTAANPAPEQPKANVPNETPLTAKPQTAESLSFSGRVLSPDGKPLAGAKVYISEAMGYLKEPYDSPAQATTGPDGRFECAAPKDKFGEYASVVAASAAGYGAAWVNANPQRRSGLTIRLVKDDVPVTGQIV